MINPGDSRDLFLGSEMALLELSLSNAIQFIIIGLAVGFMGGFLGVGGGVIIIPLLTYWVFPSMKVLPQIIVHLAFGTSLAIVIPTSISGTYAHARKRNITWEIVYLLALPGIFSSFLGSTIASYLKGDLLKILFGVLLIFLSTQMFLEKEAGEAEKENIEKAPKFKAMLVGFVVGMFSGFFGLGGGVIAIPLLVRFLKVPIHRAMGISLAFVFFISFVGTLGYIYHGWKNPQLPSFALGYVHVWGGLMAGVPSLFLARLGTNLAYKIRPLRMRKIFALLLVGVGTRMLF